MFFMFDKALWMPKFSPFFFLFFFLTTLGRGLFGVVGLRTNFLLRRIRLLLPTTIQPKGNFWAMYKNGRASSGSFQLSWMMIPRRWTASNCTAA
ncbi:hypothetical protein GQ43DRAFT_281588 [Delitschia confertaspora ATCC 74209]|uniref:Uncharacterized protein n=1 Tax=Delitschia confertaspora ATCC 74209 TaxID=1513339 RepID=A0A9P4MMF0_9PLEO|nr:hypothetical protein GQ43DRAFT_281588 [Delitschia confertaspora ATCC 74209]